MTENICSKLALIFNGYSSKIKKVDPYRIPGLDIDDKIHFYAFFHVVMGVVKSG